MIKSTTIVLFILLAANVLYIRDILLILINLVCLLIYGCFVFVWWYFKRKNCAHMRINFTGGKKIECQVCGLKAANAEAFFEACSAIHAENR
jgi:hypothetical protein